MLNTIFMRNYSRAGGRKGLPAYRTPSSFRSNVFKIVKSIPKGKVMTYKEVAKAAGNEKACRVVGNILNKNYDSKIPCHRVIRSDGKIGGYNRGSDLKKQILEKEGFLKKNK